MSREILPGLAADALALDSKTVGALPIINHFLRRLGVEAMLRQYVPSRSNQKLSHAETLMILIRSILIEREPVYEIGEWAALSEPTLVGLGTCTPDVLGDDRFGRSLDALFMADRATLATDLVLRMIKAFKIDLTQLHNDSTSIAVTGEYRAPTVLKGKRSIKLKRGHSKDHRPDLKQLLFTLTISRDGAVPIHYKTYDGNVTDDTTHIDTWDCLRRLIGHPRFTYVADCKLSTREQMDYITREGGRFITIMPRTRTEDRDFRQMLRSGQSFDWFEILRRKKNDSPAGAEDIYWGIESPSPSSEGYRIIWVKSSQKREFDEQQRKRKVDKTIIELAKLKARVGSRRLRTKTEIQEAIDGIFADNGSAQWFDCQLTSCEVESFKQRGKGRPGKNTQFERQIKAQWTFEAFPAFERIQVDAADDGIFPLITNHPLSELSAQDVLEKYKYQPFIEKRHEQLKSVFDAAPVYFKLPYRIEALMFLYFVVLIVNALIERELRQAMEAKKVASLPLYPEARLCRKPTTERLITVFGGHQRHVLKLDDKEVKIFRDQLTPLQQTVLDLLGVSHSAYLM